MTHQILEICESTNLEARKLAESGAIHGSWVSAKRQTHGRGRMGRDWVSDEGNLFLSLVTRIEPISNWTWIPLVTALGIVRALKKFEPTLKVEIKWPNDLRVGGKKLAGVLCEGVMGRDDPFAIVGVGLNCKSSPKLDASAPQPAISLSELLSKSVTADELRDLIVQEILSALEELEVHGPASLAREYQDSAELRPGIHVEWMDLNKNIPHAGVVVGLGIQGELRVKENGRDQYLTSEEVRLQPK